MILFLLGYTLLQATPKMTVKHGRCNSTFGSGPHDRHEKSHHKWIQRWSLEHRYRGSIRPPYSDSPLPLVIFTFLFQIFYPSKELDKVNKPKQQTKTILLYTLT